MDPTPSAKSLGGRRGMCRNGRRDLSAAKPARWVLTARPPTRITEVIQKKGGSENDFIVLSLTMTDFPPVRRVVTGHGANQVAKILIDGVATNRRTSKSGGMSTLIWCTDRTPADISVGENAEDMGARVLGTPPPPNGTRFTVNDIPPGRSGPMHRTETIDYVIVLAGELEMQMDDSTVKLEAGDVLVQRGTNHAWINRGPKPARVAFVLIDAKPLGIGHPLTGGAAVR